MNNNFTFTISILLLCMVLIACNFTDGETRNDRQKPVVKTENEIDKTKSKNKEKNVQPDETAASENTTVSGKNEYKKFETFPCNFNRMGYALIPRGLNREELIELAQKIHTAEPATALFLIDDDAEADDHIYFMRQWCKGEADKSNFPEEWADKHVVASIMRGKDANWDLYEGSQKDAYLDYNFDDREKTKIADLNDF